VTPSELVETLRHFDDHIAEFISSSLLGPEDEGSTILRNIGNIMLPLQHHVSCNIMLSLQHHVSCNIMLSLQHHVSCKFQSKVQLCLCTKGRCIGASRYSSIIYWLLHSMEVNVYFPPPAPLPSVDDTSAHWTGGSVGSRAGLDFLERGNIPYPYRDSNPGQCRL
jgi:hypothetical protein